MNTRAPRKRALARYLGGKNRIAPWIISFFPPHKIYVEPFGGSGAVLLNKQPAWMEVYNDLYDRVVNFFEVLRDPEKSARLASLLELTPYAQTAYARSFEIAEDQVEDALRFAINSMMSYGGGIHKPGFKRNGLLRTTPYPQTWREYPAVVRECAAELRNRNIEINNMDALQVMSRYDTPDTLHYVDPPYGFPSLVDVFQQRLVLAATQAQPQTVWLSKTDDLNNFEVGKQDDSALALTLSTTTQNRICWLMAQSSRLLLGTADAEWAVSGGQGVMTPTNARADNHGFVGSSDVPAMMATDKVLYIERGGGRVYQYGYDYENDGYVSRDLTVFADHVLADGGGCRDIAFIRKPEPRAVFVRRDGQLALMTYNSMHQVNAWHRYTTDGTFEGVAALPNGDKADLLFALVVRDDGRFIEALAPDNEFQDPDGRDYVSSLETNALISLEAAGRRQHNSSVMFFFGSDALVSGIEVSIDGRLWDVPDRAPSSFLERGWHSLVADGCWNYDSMVGIRVSGNRDFNLLAIQA